MTIRISPESLRHLRLNRTLNTLQRRVARAHQRPAELVLLRQCTRFERIHEPPATGLMTTIFARSPLQSLPMATNRPTTRRRSVKQAFEDDDAPAPKRPRTEVNGTSKRTATAKKAAKAAYDEDDDGFHFSRRTSKRTSKAQAVPAPEPIPEEPPAKSARAQEPLPAKPTARRKKTTTTVVELEVADTQKRRHSTRLSGDREELKVRPKAAKQPATKPTKKSAPVEKERKKHHSSARNAARTENRSHRRKDSDTK
jgi:kinetochore protein Mis13/DSN1